MRMNGSTLSSRIASAAIYFVSATCGATLLFLFIAVAGKNLDLNRDLVAGLAILGGLAGAVAPVVWLRRAQLKRPRTGGSYNTPPAGPPRTDSGAPGWKNLMNFKFSKPVIAGAIGVGLLAFWFDLSPNPKLRVEDSGGAIRVTNLGANPVEIVNVTINDREDCKPILDLGIVSGYPKDLAGNPTPLKTGDSVEVLFVGCNVSIIKARVSTRSRTYTYSFE
jgi:hypothetical protein